jgi:hypothetical protein
VLLRSWRFPISPLAGWARAHETEDVLRAYAWAHQEWMLRSGWPVMLARTIELASLSLRAAGRPLSLQSAGRWMLSEEGSLVPDEAASADRLQATG